MIPEHPEVRNLELTRILCAAFPGPPWHPEPVKPRRVRTAWRRFLAWART